MLWTLLKVLFFVTLVVALAFGAEALINSADSVTVVLFGTEYVLAPLVAVLALGLLLLAMWLVLKLAGLLVAVLRFINGDETALSRYFDRNRERRGYAALTEGMMALASGEHGTAISKARTAEKLLQKPELTTLLTAQAAEASGDRTQASEAYKRLLGHDQTRFVGVRGLMQQRLAEGDTETATKLAEKAFALKPKHGDTQDTLLKLQAGDENWSGARATLTAKLKSGTLPKDVHRRRHAVLSIAQARDALALGKTEEARSEALEANRLSPELVPGAVLAARMHIDAGSARKAAAVIKPAWKAMPHPDLAAAFAEIAPDETPAARLKRFNPLLKLLPTHAESRMLAAELHIAAEDFPGARKALGDLAETDPSARALTLMAAIERGEGAADHVVRAFLARAATASRGPAWVCGNCGTAHGAWTPVCDNCGAFDTLNWIEPKGAPEENAVLPTGMLPLIVGALEDKSETVDPEEAPVAEVVVDADAPGEEADEGANEDTTK